jgi:regulator of protease activity HflC (stomatin/prohibitin superfamily)
MAVQDIKVVNPKAKTVKNIVIGVIIALIAIIILSNSFTTVKAGHSGVIVTFGEVSERLFALYGRVRTFICYSGISVQQGWC